MSLLTALFSISSGFEWIFHGVLAAVGALLIAATVLARDLWPFSHYPMFAEPLEATRLGFFAPRFRLRDGRTLGLTGLARVLEDDFHRACEGCWPNMKSGKAALDAVGLRFWREALQLEPSLAQATTLEVVLRVAQLGPQRGIAVAEKSIHTVNLRPAEAA
jgi:hypothetical protein